MFINACDNKHAQIRELYAAHRLNRNQQQKEKFLSPDFKELIIDQHLLRIVDQTVEPGFKDERNCFVFWARPPEHIILLAAELQHRLQAAAPHIWLMPLYRMHLTVLELAFSKTPQEMKEIVETVSPVIPGITSHTHSHRPRLVKPLISYDLSAFAVSFLPALGEKKLSPLPIDPDTAENIVEGDEYTYHHLRKEVFDKAKESGVHIGSRYQVPSAHITLGRYLTHEDHDTPEKRLKWIQAIDDTNKWLMEHVWDTPAAEYIGEWIVGQERGLDCRTGTLWYGGGRTIMMGEGF
ncbi:hypothetical protein Golomagni_06208 [Golovinomyces magnicellulatus]|nr:hypothetical protein Golomagni_06208 [Golovinomyces magnicellulatus]